MMHDDFVTSDVGEQVPFIRVKNSITSLEGK